MVHTTSLKAAIYGGLAGRLAGIPVVWGIADRMAPDYLRPTTIRGMRMLARVLPSAIVVNSEASREALPGLKTTEINPPVRLPTARHRPVEKGVRGPLRFVMVGRITPWKGQRLFIEAFARAFPDGGERVLIAGSAMFGEEEYLKELHEIVDRHGLDGRVEFLGFVEDTEELLASCDVVVHASVIPEPFGRVVVEGMAAGRPVIAANAGGPAEIITDEVDGLLFEPRNVDDLARALTRTARDPSLRERLGRAGMRRAQDFRPEAVADAYEEVYRAVVTTRRTSRSPGR